jgi:hypothetical protein
MKDIGVAVWAFDISSNAGLVSQILWLRTDQDGWWEYRTKIERLDLTDKALLKGISPKRHVLVSTTDWSESLMRRTRRTADENEKKAKP